MKKNLWIIILISILCFMTACSNKDLEKKEPSINNEQVQQEETVNYIVTEEEARNNNLVNENVVIKKEDDMINYFENLEQEVEQETNQPLTEEIKSKLKNTFITVVDFLFYDGVIGGVTFDSLTEETKLKVLEIIDSIDNKIESKLPGYKETIKTTTGKVYTKVKEKISQGMTSLDQFLQEKMDEDTYQAMQDGIDDLKKGFSNATEVIKDTGSNIKDKVKEWYENFRD